MNGLDVTLHKPRCAANRERPGSRKRPDQFPALAGHHAEQKFGGGKADTGALLTALEGLLRAALDVGERSDLQRYGLHPCLQSSTSFSLLKAFQRKLKSLVRVKKLDVFHQKCYFQRMLKEHSRVETEQAALKQIQNLLAEVPFLKIEGVDHEPSTSSNNRRADFLL